MQAMIDVANVVRILAFPDGVFGATMCRRLHRSAVILACGKICAKPARHPPSPSSGRAGVGLFPRQGFACVAPTRRFAPPSPKTAKTGRDKALSHPIAPPGVAVPQVCDDGFPRGRSLAFGGERARAVRQVDIDPRAEPDHPDAL